MAVILTAFVSEPEQEAELCGEGEGHHPLGFGESAGLSLLLALLQYLALQGEEGGFSHYRYANQGSKYTGQF
jgi:hypothetical protein